MALLFVDSFDHYQTADLQSKWTSSSAGIALAVGRCGGNAASLGSVGTLLKGLPFGSSRGTVGFAYYPVGAATIDPTYAFVSFGNTTTEHLYLRVNTDGSLQAFRRGNVSLGLSSAGLIHEDRWYYIEMQALIDGTVGEVIVRVNNTPVITATGVNTAGGGDTLLRYVAVYAAEGTSVWRCDDLYVLDDTGPAPNNTFLGDVKVEYLRPRAAGPAQAWTLVGTQPSHWQAVDNNATPDGDGSYVESVTPGQTDTNLYQPTGLPSGPIFGAQLSLLARKAAIGPRVISPVVNSLAGSPHVYLSADSYQYHSSIHALNPATGLPWTIAEINAANFGVTVAS